MKSLLFFIFLFGTFLFAACDNSPKTTLHSRSVKKHHITKTDTSTYHHDTITIAAVGDMMLGSAYPNLKNLPADSAKNSFKAAADYLREADVAFGNLEGALVDSGIPEGRKLLKPYSFRMPVKYGNVFKDAGFDILSLANNHVGDFGENGRRSTVAVLDSLGIYHAGLQRHPTAIFTINEVKYGFCAFSPNGYIVPLNDLKNAARIIRELKQQVDIVIVSFHGGGEGVAFEHVLCEKETFIGENRGDVHAFAHNAIDAGADVVFGNGPHVCRAMELYNNRLIAYSLGNFCTYTSVSVLGVCGMAPLLQVHLNKKGEFINGNIIAFKQTHLNGLLRDTTNAVVKRIKYLTEIDFPQSGLSIDPTGKIKK